MQGRCGVGWVGGLGCGGVESLPEQSQACPISHCSLCTLILCAGTRDPLMHRCVARTEVISILLLTYPHVFE